VVLLSGGLDSATALAVAVDKGLACYCLSIDYGQRHAIELDAARRVASALGAVEHRIVRVDLRAIGGSALTDRIDVPKDRIPEPGAGAGSIPDDAPADPGSDAIPITYVPARNLLFLSLGVGCAEVLGASEIFIGVNAIDYSGYPDCRRQFIESFQRTAELATRAGVTGRPLVIRTPLIDMTKAQIIRLGACLGVDFSLTHSCYDPDSSGAACGRCDSCLLRARGFAEAGIPDPTRYAAETMP